MYHLPSEQTKLVEEAKKEFAEKGELTISEPCNCGSQIRHNNGGNYHCTVEFKKDSDRYFERRSSTSNFDSEPEWNETTEESILKTIEEWADCL
jgi:hypothetical protein